MSKQLWISLILSLSHIYIHTERPYFTSYKTHFFQNLTLIITLPLTQGRSGIGIYESTENESLEWIYLIYYQHPNKSLSSILKNTENICVCIYIYIYIYTVNYGVQVNVLSMKTISIKLGFDIYSWVKIQMFIMSY